MKRLTQRVSRWARAWLARISHTCTAAAADALAVARRTPSCRFDVVSATPSPSLGPCDAPQRRLDALATRRREKCGPGIVIACIALGTVSVAHASHIGIRASIAEHARELAGQALAYEHGEGVPQDPAHAAVLYCESARLGDVEAMVALGWMYANGRGIPRDDAHAGTLFRMAAQHGNEYAQRMMRFTGSGGDSMPSCLKTPPAIFADSESRIEERISALSPARQAIARLVVELASDYEISPSFALAIAITESALNPRAVSPKNAMGVMQLIPGTAARFNVRDVFDPAENIRGGLAYLRWLLAYFEGDTLLAAAAYNAGEGAVERYQGVPPFRETRAYVERIMQFINYRHHPFDADLVAPSEIVSVLKLARQKEDGS